MDEIEDDYIDKVIKYPLNPWNGLNNFSLIETAFLMGEIDPANHMDVNFENYTDKKLKNIFYVNLKILMDAFDTNQFSCPNAHNLQTNEIRQEYFMSRTAQVGSPAKRFSNYIEIDWSKIRLPKCCIIKFLNKINYNSIFFHFREIYENEKMIKNSRSHETKSEVCSEIKEANNLKIIGAMLNSMVTRGEKSKLSSFPSEAELIREMLNHNEHKFGISKTTLENRFREAKKALEQEN